MEHNGSKIEGRSVYISALAELNCVYISVWVSIQMTILYGRMSALYYEEYSANGETHQVG
jgi:hypothetical protein